MIVLHSSKKNSDVLLALQRIKPVAMSHCSLHFNFSRLLDKYKSSYQVRIAVNTIRDTLGEDSDGLIYTADNLDVFVIFNNKLKDRIYSMVYRLKHLFMDDHIINDTQDIDSKFCTVYDLYLQWNSFLSCITQSTNVIPAKENRIDSSFFNENKSPLVLSNSLYIESHIQHIDITKCIKIRTCYLTDKNKIRPIFDTIIIDYTKLFDHLKINIDIDEKSYLYKHLNDIVYKKMLNSISTKKWNRAINIALNIECILSYSFTYFCENNIKKSHPNSITVDIELNNALSNMENLELVLEKLKKYNINYALLCSTPHIPVLTSEMKNFHLFKVLATLDPYTYKPSIDHIILDNIPRKRIIIYNVDTEQMAKSLINEGFFLLSGEYFNTDTDTEANNTL